jgi:outer membrane immunogenic protein
MKKIVLATVLAALGSASALAADLPARGMYAKAPMMTPIDSWAGLYIGGNVGYGWGTGNTDAVYNPTGTGAANASLGSKSNGVIGGGQIGYNWQAGSFVYGLEADIDGAGLRSTSRQGLIDTAGFAEPAATSFVTATNKLDWFGTVRGRLGLTVTPNFLLYGTGGFAFGGVDNSANTQFSTTPGASAAASVNTTRTGWTAGAGAEWMFAHNWSAKLEYLYLDLGKSSATGNETPALTPVAATYTWHNQENIVRVGVNYHFN